MIWALVGSVITAASPMWPAAQGGERAEPAVLLADHAVHAPAAARAGRRRRAGCGARRGWRPRRPSCRRCRGRTCAPSRISAENGLEPEPVVRVARRVRRRGGPGAPGRACPRRRVDVPTTPTACSRATSTPGNHGSSASSSRSMSQRSTSVSRSRSIAGGVAPAPRPPRRCRPCSGSAPAPSATRPARARRGGPGRRARRRSARRDCSCARVCRTPPAIVRGVVTVAVCEDDAALRSVLTRSVKAAGHDVVVARTGAEALRQLPAGRPRRGGPRHRASRQRRT